MLKQERAAEAQAAELGLAERYLSLSSAAVPTLMVMEGPELLGAIASSLSSELVAPA